MSQPGHCFLPKNLVWSDVKDFPDFVQDTWNNVVVSLEPCIKDFWKWWHRGDAAVAHLGSWLHVQGLVVLGCAGSCVSRITALAQKVPWIPQLHDLVHCNPQHKCYYFWREDRSIFSSHLGSLGNLEERCWYHPRGRDQDIHNRCNTQQNPAKTGMGTMQGELL